MKHGWSIKDPLRTLSKPIQKCDNLLAVTFLRNINNKICCSFNSIHPANTKQYLYNICTTSAQRLRRWSNIVQMIYKYVLCLLGNRLNVNEYLHISTHDLIWIYKWTKWHRKELVNPTWLLRLRKPLCPELSVPRPAMETISVVLPHHYKYNYQHKNAIILLLRHAVQRLVLQYYGLMELYLLVFLGQVRPFQDATHTTRSPKAELLSWDSCYTLFNNNTPLRDQNLSYLVRTLFYAQNRSNSVYHGLLEHLVRTIWINSYLFFTSCVEMPPDVSHCLARQRSYGEVG